MNDLGAHYAHLRHRSETRREGCSRSMHCLAIQPPEDIRQVAYTASLCHLSALSVLVRGCVVRHASAEATSKTIQSMLSLKLSSMISTASADFDREAN